MNEGVLLLKEVAKLKDIVSLGVCVSIFQTCNGKQFKNMPASDFFCFLNLKLPKEKVTTLPGEKQRICYMIYVVSQTIVPADFAKTWIVYTNLKVYHFLIKKCTTPNRLRRYA